MSPTTLPAVGLFFTACLVSTQISDPVKCLCGM